MATIPNINDALLTNLNRYNNSTILDVLLKMSDNGTIAGLPPTVVANASILGDTLAKDPFARNNFIHSVINKIGLQLVNTLYFSDPLAVFRKGNLENGESVEETYIDKIEAYNYNLATDLKRLFGLYLPKASTIYHVANSKLVYPYTIADKEIRLMLLNPNGISQWLEKFSQSLFSSIEHDEYLLIKNVFLSMFNAGEIFPVNTPAQITSQADAIQFINAVKTTAELFRFPSTNYNFFGHLVSTPPEKLVLVIKATTKVAIESYLDAFAFNEKFVTLPMELLVIDEFPDPMDSPANRVQAILCDYNTIQLYGLNGGIQSEEQRDGANMTTNVFTHKWDIYSRSPFTNVAIFGRLGSPDLTAAYLNITPTSVPTQGAYQPQTSGSATGKITLNAYVQYIEFMALLTVQSGVNGYVPESVVWTLTGSDDGTGQPASWIDNNGLLVIGSNEQYTGGQITVHASVYNQVNATTFTMTFDIVKNY
jgi:hypothetical protein